MSTLVRASQRFLPRETIIDVASASDRLAEFEIRIDMPAFTQNSTTRASAGAVGRPCKFVRGYLSYSTKPAGGTLSTKAVALDASDSATSIDITADFNPESLTDNIPGNITADATNVALAANDIIEVVATASDDAVSAAGTRGVIVLVFRPLNDIEPAFTRVGSV